MYGDDCVRLARLEESLQSFDRRAQAIDGDDGISGRESRARRRAAHHNVLEADLSATIQRRTKPQPRRIIAWSAAFVLAAFSRLQFKLVAKRLQIRGPRQLFASVL